MRRLLLAAWALAAWLAARRRLRARREDVQRWMFRQQTRGMGLRGLNWLRRTGRRGAMPDERV